MEENNNGYTPTKTENLLDWGKLIVNGIIVPFGTMIVSGLLIKSTCDKMEEKRNNPDKYWDKQNKKGCNSAHVVADGLHHVADAINNLK